MVSLISFFVFVLSRDGRGFFVVGGGGVLIVEADAFGVWREVGVGVLGVGVFGVGARVERDLVGGLLGQPCIAEGGEGISISISASPRVKRTAL